MTSPYHLLYRLQWEGTWGLDLEWWAERTEQLWGPWAVLWVCFFSANETVIINYKLTDKGF